METTRGGLTGSLLDRRYRIGSVIARGGMSTVYRGLDTRLDRPVAVKVMAAQYAHDPAFLTRFSREARLAAGLSDPGVVAVYDHGRDGEHAFLVMELVDGGTLRDLLHQQGPLSVEVTVSVLRPLLSALTAAHRAGLVHRDVKPENVLISAQGTVKVADFGLVRAVTSHTVATGDVILGTVAYLSPEQVETGASDARSDVYSAGIVGWEMLAGEPPFTGENALSVAYQHVHSDVPMIGDLVDDVPAALEDLIADATQREPEHRPRDAAAFASRLAGICARAGIHRVPIPVPTRPQPARPTDDAGASLPAGPAGPGGPPRTAIAARSAGPEPFEAAARWVDLDDDVDRTSGRAATRLVAGPDAPTGQLAGPAGTRVVHGGGPATVDEPREDQRQPGPVRRRRWLRRLIWIVVILLVGLAAAAAGWWIGDGRWVYAPTTVGLTQQAAENAVREAGLIPQVAVSTDNAAPVGTVARAQPIAGVKLLRGSPIDLVISTGRPTIPELTPGSTVEEAKASLVDAGMTVRSGPIDRVYDDTVPAGTLVRTSPAGGTEATTGTSVTLVVSLGPRPIVIPEVAGKAVDDARNKLIVTGFTVGADVPRFDAQAADGAVLGTEPAAGRTLPKGAAVALVINTSTSVPDVRGSTLAAAQQALTDQGYDVTVADARFDAAIDGGSVVASDPAAGSRIDPDRRAVTLFPSDAVVVPDVSSGDLRQAKDTLAGAGLNVAVAGLFQFGSSNVIGQTPDAGERIEPGGTVYVSVLF